MPGHIQREGRILNTLHISFLVLSSSAWSAGKATQHFAAMSVTVWIH
jgi:hypothetical protein